VGWGYPIPNIIDVETRPNGTFQEAFVNLRELMQFKSLKFLWSTLVGEGCLGMIGGMVVFKGRFIEWKPEDIWSKEPATNNNDQEF